MTCKRKQLTETVHGVITCDVTTQSLHTGGDVIGSNSDVIGSNRSISTKYVVRCNASQNQNRSRRQILFSRRLMFKTPFKT